MGRHMEKSYYGSGRSSGGSIIPPNYKQDPIKTLHKLGVIVLRCGSIRSHEGVYGQVLIYQGTFGTVQEVAPCLSSQADTLHLQVPHHIIQ